LFIVSTDYENTHAPKDFQDEADFWVWRPPVGTMWNSVDGVSGEDRGAAEYARVRVYRLRSSMIA
jgi:hypothetical protein